MGTTAGHVVAALGALDEDFAGRTTFPALEGPLEVAVACAFVFDQLTLFAVLCAASVALMGDLGFIYHALAAFFGAQLEIRVAYGLLPYTISAELLF